MAILYSHTKLGAALVTTTVFLSWAGTARGDSGAEPGATPSALSATTQALWQIQVAGCTEHCRGTSQTQVGLQENTTTQASAPAPVSAEPAGVDGSPTRGGATASSNSRPSGGAPLTQAHPTHGGAPRTERPPARGGAAASTTKPGQTRTVRQIQLGCVSHCFGSTRTTGSSAAAEKRVIDQLLGPSNPPTVPVIEPAAATQQSGVVQASVQVQEGTPSRPEQSQSAVQSSATSQQAPGAAGDATSGVVQGIWQLQIGCLRWCVNTRQRQRADQVSTTTHRRFPAPAARDVSRGSAVNHTHQLIWQVQIGCVAWCYRATERQAATQTNTTPRVPATHLHRGAPPERGVSRRGFTPTSSPAPPASTEPQRSAVSPSRKVVPGAGARRAPRRHGSRSPHRTPLARPAQRPSARVAARVATNRSPDETIVTAILALVAAFAASFGFRPQLTRR